MRLMKYLPKFRNYNCYFQDYFTSEPLHRGLKGLGIWNVGTIHVLKTEVRREGRGNLDANVSRKGAVTIVR